MTPAIHEMTLIMNDSGGIDAELSPLSITGASDG